MRPCAREPERWDGQGIRPGRDNEAAKDELSKQMEYRGQGLTLVHFPAQPEPFLTQNTP
jgi:hypothetical protein